MVKVPGFLFTVVVSLIGCAMRSLVSVHALSSLELPSPSVDADEESAGRATTSTRDEIERLPVDYASEPIEPHEVVVTGEIIACAGCGLNEMPELWSFLVEGEVDYYHGIQKSWTRSGSPQVILTVYNNGRYVDSIVLSDDASWTKPDYHRMVRESGFKLKDEDGRKAAKEAAEKDIRDEAAWRRYRSDYYDRRSRHVHEFMTLVMTVLPTSGASSEIIASCFAPPSVKRAAQLASPVASSVLESNYDRNNPNRLHYVRTGRWPKRRRKRQKVGSNPTVAPKAPSEAEAIERKSPGSSAHPTSSHFYPLYDKPSSYFILLQRKADIEEKIRAIKRKRIAFPASDTSSRGTTPRKPASARPGMRRPTRRRRRMKSSVINDRSRRDGGNGGSHSGRSTGRRAPRSPQRSKSAE